MTAVAIRTPTLRVLSLGAGVQSTTLALMAARGEIEAPDCAIFADTGWEPAAVYTHLDWLTAELPFPVHRVTAGDLRSACLENAAGNVKHGKLSTVPAFARNADGTSGPLIRQCTRDYKVDAIERELRRMLGVAPGRRAPRKPVVEQWLGISTDEAHRMKPARRLWAVNRWPLIEAGMSRASCLRWFGHHYPGRTLAKSACIGCPYHSDVHWRDMRDNDPASWADAVAFDAAIRGGFKGGNGEIYLHRSLVPLDQVDLRNWGERGQPDLFGNECFGMCGT